MGFFLFSLLSSCLLFVRLCDLHNVSLFLRTGGDGDQDVEGEEVQQLFLCSFYFCLQHPLLGAGPSLSVVVEELALSLKLSEWYYGAGC